MTNTKNYIKNFSLNNTYNNGNGKYQELYDIHRGDYYLFRSEDWKKLNCGYQARMVYCICDIYKAYYNESTTLEEYKSAEGDEMFKKVLI